MCVHSLSHLLSARCIHWLLTYFVPWPHFWNSILLPLLISRSHQGWVHLWPWRDMRLPVQHASDGEPPMLPGLQQDPLQIDPSEFHSGTVTSYMFSELQMNNQIEYECVCLYSWQEVLSEFLISCGFMWINVTRKNWLDFWSILNNNMDAWQMIYNAS